MLVVSRVGLASSCLITVLLRLSGKTENLPIQKNAWLSSHSDGNKINLSSAAWEENRLNGDGLEVNQKHVAMTVRG